MIHLLHGNFGLPGDWDAVLAGLPAEFTGDRVRHRAWNLWRTQRDWPEADSPGAWAERFNCEVAAGSRPRVVAGYSLGGRLAMHALIRDPSVWDAAVIVAASPGIAGRDARESRRQADREWARRCMNDPWPEVVADWNRQPVFEGSPPGRSAEELGEWRDAIAAGFLSWSTGVQEDLTEDLAALRVPVVWCTGGRDAAFTRPAAACAARNPAIRHRIIAGAGHRLLKESPEALADAIRTALALAGPGGGVAGRG